MSLPDNRLRFQGPRFDFVAQVGLTGQDHDDYPDVGGQPRYDQLRMYLIALLANQSSFNEPLEYRDGSLWFNLNTSTLQIYNNQGWHNLAGAIRLDPDVTLQQWYTAVKTQLMGDPDQPEPFTHAVFTNQRYIDPEWIAGLGVAKLIGPGGHLNPATDGGIDASMITGVFPSNRFPQIQISGASPTNILNGVNKSVLFINAAGNLAQDSGTFTYDSMAQALELNVTDGYNASLKINQNIPTNEARIWLQHPNHPGALYIATVGAPHGQLGVIAGDAYIASSRNLVFSTDSGQLPTIELVADSRIVHIHSDATNGTLNLHQDRLGNANTIGFQSIDKWTYIGLEGGGQYAMGDLANIYIAGDGTLLLSLGQGTNFGSTFPIRISVTTRDTYGTDSPVFTLFNVTGRTGDRLTGLVTVPGCVDRDYTIGDKVEYSLALVYDSHVTDDFVIRTPHMIRFSVDDGVTTTLLVGQTGTTVSNTLYCMDILASGSVIIGGNFGGVGATLSGDLSCRNIAAGVITGIIDQDNVINLIHDLSTKANDAYTVHTSGTESITGGKTITASNGDIVPLRLAGLVGQTANLQEWRNSGGLLASVSHDGIFTGDGSGLINVNLTDIGSATGFLGIAHGGTGATTLDGAQTNLGLVIGSTVQGHDTNLDTIAALGTAKGSLLAGSGSDWTILPLGTNGTFLVADSARASGLRWSASMSSPDGTGDPASWTSERYGSGAVAASISSVAVGYQANAAGDYTVAVGASLTVSPVRSVGVGYGVSFAGSTNIHGVGIGYGATVAGIDAIAIGYNAAVYNDHDVAIGSGASIIDNLEGSGIAIGYGTTAYGTSLAVGDLATTGPHIGCIVLGNRATATAANQLVIGSPTTTIADVYFGTGVATVNSTADDAAATIHGTGGSGNDNVGSNLVLAGGQGTGAASGGGIIFEYAPAGSPGAAPNTLVECGRFTNTGLFSILNGLMQPAAGNVGLIIQGADSQTADLLQCKNNSGGILMKLSAAGALTVAGGAAVTGVATLTTSFATTLLSITSTTVTSGAGNRTIGLSQAVSGASTNGYGILANTSNSANIYSVFADVNGTGGSNAILPGLFGLYSRITSGGGADTYGLCVDNNNTGSGNTYGAYLNTQGNAGGKMACGVYVKATTTNVGTNMGVYANAAFGAVNYAAWLEGRAVVKGLATYGDSDTAELMEVRDASDNIYASISRYGVPGYNLHMGGLCEGRLSVSSTNPYPPTDAVAITSATVYYLPYLGDRITLYRPNTTILETLALTSLNLSLGGTDDLGHVYTYATNYDIFVVNGGTGTASLVATKWADSTATGTTARATALLRTPAGLVVKTGAFHQRYVGTIRTNDGALTTEDGPVRRFVWNHHNRRPRRLAFLITKGNWVYASGNWRPMNQTDLSGLAIRHVQFVIGMQDGALMEARAFLAASVPSSGAAYSALAVDQPTGTSDGGWGTNADVYGRLASTTTGAVDGVATATLIFAPLAGYHYLTAMEKAINTVNCYGTDPTAGAVSGLLTSVWG